MAEAETLQHELLQAQNSDGGWGYQRGSSWTEPTALALLALTAREGSLRARASAMAWLQRTQRPDGGWGPQPSVDQSTSVTSFATLALAGAEWTVEQHRLGVTWLVGQLLPADSAVVRFISRLQDTALDPRPVGGVPWFPGTAAWISPTASSIFALSDEVARGNQELRPYIFEAQQFIFSRRCLDGGWNHGGAKDRSQTATSYPEITGMALLALRGADSSKLLLSLQRATSFLDSPTSSEALSWLQLGLLAHGHDHRRLRTELPCRTTRDVSLRLLALAGTSKANRLLGA